MSSIFAPITGYASDVLYGIESSFRSSVTPDRHFGWGQRLNTLEISRNYERVFTLGSRELQKHIFKQLEASVAVSFMLSDVNVFQTFLKCTVDSTTGAYTCVIPDSTPSMTIDVFYGKDGSNADVVELVGAVVNTARLRVSAERVAEMSLDIRAGEVVLKTGQSLPEIASGTNIGQYVYTFAGAEVVVDATTIPATGLSIAFNPNVEVVYALGDDRPASVVGRQFLITGTVTMFMQDLTYHTKLMNNEAITIKVTLNGYDNVGNVSAKPITIELGGIQKIESVSSPINDVGGVEMEYRFIASKVTVTG